MSDQRINPIAAARLSGSQITGPKLLAIFQALADQMDAIGAEGNFSQMQFITDPTELTEGDLVPEIHLSIRRYTGPILGAPLEVEEDGN